MKKFIPFVFIIILPVLLNGKPTGLLNHATKPLHHFQSVTPPEYPGGQKALERHVLGKIKWPEERENKVLEVIISFFVEKDGSLTGFKIEKSLSQSFDNQVLAILKNSPKWIPAMRNERPVKSKYTLPIRYHISYRQIDSLKQ